MDKCFGKEISRNKIQKLILVLILCGIIGFCFTDRSVFAANEPQQQGENKVEVEIEIEKQAIVAKIEHPSVAFPVRWKNPEFPEEKEYILKQDFRDEIKRIIEIGNE